MIILLACFFNTLNSLSAQDKINMLPEAIADAAKGRATTDIKTVVAVQNPTLGTSKAEIDTIRINGKLLISDGSNYIYRALQEESSRVITVSLLINDKGQKPFFISQKHELSGGNLKAEIFVKVIVNYKEKKLRIIEYSN